MYNSVLDPIFTRTQNNCNQELRILWFLNVSLKTPPFAYIISAGDKWMSMDCWSNIDSEKRMYSEQNLSFCHSLRDKSRMDWRGKKTRPTAVRIMILTF